LACDAAIGGPGRSAGHEMIATRCPAASFQSNREAHSAGWATLSHVSVPAKRIVAPAFACGATGLTSIGAFCESPSGHCILRHNRGRIGKDTRRRSRRSPRLSYERARRGRGSTVGTYAVFLGYFSAWFLEGDEMFMRTATDSTGPLR
jgi:hypothetical protein